MDFAQVEKKVATLRRDLAAGNLTVEQFKARLREMMVEDADGNWWMVGYETGEWYRHDGSDWVRADPPGRTAQQAAPKPVAQPFDSDEPEPRPFRGIMLFVLCEIGMIIVGWALGLALAHLFYDGRDNPVSWICWIGVSLCGLVPSYRSARKAWQGE
ncbi:MAG: hypothetical protein SXV54_03055 [Chloroflexota bacterium]|nr:hypothetical protein [Chloroflexota bacterium]